MGFILLRYDARREVVQHGRGKVTEIVRIDVHSLVDDFLLNFGLNSSC